MEHEQVSQVSRWAGATKRKTSSGGYEYDYSGSGPVDPPKAKEAPTPPPPQPQAPPVTDAKNYNFYQDVLGQSEIPRTTQQDTPMDPLLQPLPSIPRDPSVYNVNPQLDYDEATWAAMGQSLLRGGVAGGAYLTKQALQMGGFQGYLGAAAIGAETMSLDAVSRLYGGDYGTSYSTRRGMKVGDVMFDNFSMTNPTLSVERGINALLSTSENERSSGTVVDIFTKSGSQLANSQGIGDQVAQENLALRNWIADQSQIVVPHAY